MRILHVFIALTVSAIPTYLLTVLAKQTQAEWVSALIVLTAIILPCIIYSVMETETERRRKTWHI